MTFPRAPEPTIISMGLNCSATARPAWPRVTWLVASVQISISFWRRSSSVMMPRSYCCSTFSASFSCLSRISAFAAGVRTSAIEIVRPARVEYSNPSSFSLSRLVGHLGLGVAVDELADDLGDVALLHQRGPWNGKSAGNASLNSRRPSVVSTSTVPSPFDARAAQHDAVVAGVRVRRPSRRRRRPRPRGPGTVLAGTGPPAGGP